MTEDCADRGLVHETNASGAGGPQDRADSALEVRPICVIDDDLSVRQSLSVLLETFGFRVKAYAAGSDFLADEERHKTGCLIIDQHMPEMAGLATLAALRREAPEVPTILITGRLDSAIAARAAELAVSGILEKPFSAAGLLELVRANLRASP